MYNFINRIRFLTAPGNLLNSILTTSLLVFSTASLSKVSETEAEKLGAEFTPFGAIVAANEQASIPQWTGGLRDHEAYKAGDDGRPINPFPEDKVEFVIDSNNYSAYQDFLSAGQIEMLEKYADTYKIPVYKSRRTAFVPNEVFDAARKNSVSAELVDGGNGVKNYQSAIPFPIPNNGIEAIWNHIMRYRGGSITRNFLQAVVQTNGEYMGVKMSDTLVFPEYLKGGYDQKQDNNKLFYYKQRVTSPVRLSGNLLLVHETINQVKKPRSAWIYNAGQRRVRRAPQVSYDGPGTAAGGLRTADNFDLFNGSPDRYNWDLKGKKEMYIAYNSYGLIDKSLSYDDIIKPGHINQDHTRYELHRVWVVEATLKKDKKHLYAKRVFYIDEDTWQIAAIDQYDSRGTLWRVSEAHAVQFPQADAPWYAAEIIYDLVARKYLVLGLANEEDSIGEFGIQAKRKDFTAGALRRSGKR